MIDSPHTQPAPPRDTPAKKSKGARGREGFGTLTNRFIQEIDSLAQTIPLAMISIGGAHKTALDSFTTHIDQFGLDKDSNAGTVSIPVDHWLRFQALKRRVDRTAAAQVLVPRSFLVALVSQYDAFLGRLIQAILVVKPEILNASEKVLKFSELLTFGTVDAARDHFIEKEIETVLRRSHAEQFEWLEGVFGGPLRKELTVWPIFIELTERRNLFVHTGGQVSGQYLATCTKHGVDCTNAERGSALTVSPAYFQKSYEAVFEIGVKLAHVFWRKLRPDERELADGNLNSLTYDLIVDQKFELAKCLLDFALDVLKTHASAEHRLRFAINRVQAHKWSGDHGTATALLDKEDFSALGFQYQLAEAVLRDNFARAYSIIEQMGKAGPLTLGDYREWPLFQEIRKETKFDEAILRIFGEPLNKVFIDPRRDESVSGSSALAAGDAEEDVPDSGDGTDANSL